MSSRQSACGRDKRRSKQKRSVRNFGLWPLAATDRPAPRSCNSTGRGTGGGTKGTRSPVEVDRVRRVAAHGEIGLESLDVRLGVEAELAPIVIELPPLLSESTLLVLELAYPLLARQASCILVGFALTSGLGLGCGCGDGRWIRRSAHIECHGEQRMGVGAVAVTRVQLRHWRIARSALSSARSAFRNAPCGRSCRLRFETRAVSHGCLPASVQSSSSAHLGVSGVGEVA